MKRILAVTALFFAIAGIALFASRSVAAAQRSKGGPSGVISGVVLGPDDKPAPHAAITYQSSGGNAPHAVHANAHGHFTITKLRSDNYDLRASAKGIFSEWQKNVLVYSGRTSDVTLNLIYAREMPKSTAKPKSSKKS